MNGTIARLTRTSLLRGWRGVLLGLLPAAMLAMTFLVRTVSSSPTPKATITIVMSDLVMGTAVPLITLIIGTGAIATEIDDGSIVYLLTKPIRRWKIAVTKIAVAVVTSLLFAAVPVLLCGLILTGSLTGVTLAYGLSAVVASVVYSAVFLLLGVVSRQAVVLGLMYVLLWEQLVGGLVSGVRVLSVRYWSTSLTSGISDGVISADVNVVVAAVGAVAATIVAGWYASRRLRVLTLTGEG